MLFCMCTVPSEFTTFTRPTAQYRAFVYNMGYFIVHHTPIASTAFLARIQSQFAKLLHLCRIFVTLIIPTDLHALDVRKAAMLQ